MIVILTFHISGLKDQLNLLAEAFHKYEIAEVRSEDVRQ